MVVFFFVDKSLIPNEAILHEGVNAKFFNDPVAINSWEVVIGPTMADTLGANLANLSDINFDNNCNKSFNCSIISMTIKILFII